MTSSESPKALVQRMRSLIEEIRPSRLRRLYDEPLDLLLARFFAEHPETPSSPSAFPAALGLFMDSMANAGFPVTSGRSPFAAIESAIYLLEHTYKGNQDTGYAGALRDIRHWGRDGYVMAITAVAESIKGTLKQNHVRLAFTRHLGRLSWEDRLTLTALVQRQWGPFLAGHVRERRVEEAAPFLETLIMDYVLSDEELIRLWNRS